MREVNDLKTLGKRLKIRLKSLESNNSKFFLFCFVLKKDKKGSEIK